MSLELVSGARKTVGAKQTLKAMKRNEVTQLYVAKDCDEQVGKPLIICAQEMGIPLDRHGLPHQGQGSSRWFT